MKFLAGIFTFKSKFDEVFNNETVKDVCDKAKNLILTYRNYNELSGEEKKHRVDELLAEYIKTKVHSDNAIVQWLINSIILVIPTITQFIYDCLQEKVKGITK